MRAAYGALALGLALGSVSLFVAQSAGTIVGALMCAGGAKWLQRVRPSGANAYTGRLLEARWLAAATMLAVAGLATYLAVVLRPRVLIDDAAITFRYVDRLVDGLGFTYNDHERILGTSNPLYTLLLAVIHGAGAGMQDSARALDTVLLVASVVVAMDVGRRLSNWLGGAAAGLLLAFDSYFRAQALDGLETGLAVLLGLLVVSALIRERWTLAGVFLGLAVWNKLDAGLLAVAVAGAYLLVLRRPPWRITAVATAVFAPWAIFALVYFGSPIPRSFTSKLELETFELDRGWIADFFADDYRFALVALAAGMVVLAWTRRRTRPGEAVAVLALAGWLGLHAVFFSTVNLSARFPWYLTVLIPPGTILASAFVANGLSLPRWPLLARLGMVAAGALMLGLALRPQAVSSRDALANDRPLEPYQVFDNDRRLAAAWVDRYSRPDEVVASAFGWTAYEVDNPFNDLSRLNSRKMLPPDYYITHGFPWAARLSRAALARGYVPLATFNLASELEPGWAWFTVTGRIGSAIERSDHRYLQRHVADLPGAEDAAARAGAEFEGFDLVTAEAAEVPVSVSTEGQPLHVVFTPVAEDEQPVRFAVRAGQRTLYSGTPEPGATTKPVVLLVPAGNENRTRFVLTTSAPGRWVLPKVVIGDALPRPLESADPRVMEEFWARNPGG